MSAGGVDKLELTISCTKNTMDWSFVSAYISLSFRGKNDTSHLVLRPPGRSTYEIQGQAEQSIRRLYSFLFAISARWNLYQTHGMSESQI